MKETRLTNVKTYNLNALVTLINDLKERNLVQKDGEEGAEQSRAKKQMRKGDGQDAEDDVRMTGVDGNAA